MPRSSAKTSIRITSPRPVALEVACDADLESDDDGLEVQPETHAPMVTASAGRLAVTTSTAERITSVTSAGRVMGVRWPPLTLVMPVPVSRYGLYAAAAIVGGAVLVAAGPRLIHRIRFGR